jgi:hypothetical protein
MTSLTIVSCKPISQGRDKNFSSAMLGPSVLVFINCWFTVVVKCHITLLRLFGPAEPETSGA